MTSLADAAAQADALAEAGDERALSQLRAEWDEELESATRSDDFRERAIAFRAIAQFRFRQKIELLRRGLDDPSPAVRGSTLLALEGRKSIGRLSLGPILGALGLKLAVLPDDEALAMIRHRLPTGAPRVRSSAMRSWAWAGWGRR